VLPASLNAALATHTRLLAMPIHDQNLLANHADIGSALILLSTSLRPFIEDGLKSAYPDNWIDRAKEILSGSRTWDSRDEVNWEDSHTLLKLLKKGWNRLFHRLLRDASANLVEDLFDIRNDWAHPSPEEWRIKRLFTDDYSQKALQKILRLLAAIEDHEKSQEIQAIKARLEDRRRQKNNRFQIYNSALEYANKQLVLTSNFFNWEEETNSSRKEVYVPLGLVEQQHKRTRRGSEDGDPEYGSDLYKEKDVIKAIDEANFFEQVLREGISKSQGKCIAIIGEPGSGKTTRLQQIADWIFKSDDIAVWVPLSVIGNEKSLHHYLFDDWLNSIHPLGNASSEWKEELSSLLQDNKLWLLLDGADEMPIDSPLSFINQQITQAWVDKTRVIMTCRLNLWAASGNILASSFDVFRNLDFDSEQIDQFVSNTLGEDGQSLKDALNRSNNPRIKDLIKNPLRLMLLCKLWSQGEHQLPDTKAGLYQAFAQAIYDWKADEICRKYRWNQSKYQARQRGLSKALGEVSKRAIDGETSRFRLPETFIRSVFDDIRSVFNELTEKPHDESDPDFLELALAIGWLNEVGVATENLHERVYAFYHPRFEEYFAALAIHDGSFFFDHIPEDINLGSYRIFEPKWKEIYLLWMGSYSLPREIEIRNELIDLILDGCQDIDSSTFYSSYLLYMAAIALREFQKCNHENIEYIVNWIYCSIADDSTYGWAVKLFRQAIIETDIGCAKNIIQHFSGFHKDNAIYYTSIGRDAIIIEIFDLLYQVDPLDPDILSQIKDWIKSGFGLHDGYIDHTRFPHPYIHTLFPYTLINLSHPEIIQALLESLKRVYFLIRENKKERDLLKKSIPKTSGSSLEKSSFLQDPDHSQFLNSPAPKKPLISAHELTKNVVVGPSPRDQCNKQAGDIKSADKLSLFVNILVVLERVALRDYSTIKCVKEILTQEMVSPAFPSLSYFQENSHIYLLRYLRSITQDNNSLIQSFLKFLADKDEEVKCRAAEIILELDPKNPEGIACAKELARSGNKESTQKVMPYLFSKFYDRVYLSKVELEIFNTVCMAFLEKYENETFAILRSRKFSIGDGQKIRSYLDLAEIILSQSEEKWKGRVFASLINSIKLCLDANRQNFCLEKVANLVVSFCDSSSEQCEDLINIFHEISDESYQENLINKLMIAFALISVRPDNQEVMQFIIDSYNNPSFDDHYGAFDGGKRECFDRGFEGKCNTYKCLISMLKSCHDSQMEWVHIFAKIANNENRLEIINALVSRVDSIPDLKTKCNFAHVIGLIEKDHDIVVQILMYILEKGDVELIKYAIRVVQNLKLDCPAITHKIVELSMSEDETGITSNYVVRSIIQDNTLAKETQKLIVLNSEKVHPEILWHCTKKMSYKDFYITQLEK
jgi:ABC-type dipeptide/oligopeptide/nickel transport system ATPase subunit